MAADVPYDDQDPGEGVDVRKRRFLAAATAAVGAVGTGLLAVPLVESLEPNEGVEAAASTTVDISRIAAGHQAVVKWQDKPVFIVHRTPAMLETLTAVTPHLLDPHSEQPQQPLFAKNIYRSLRPEWLVMVGICTHLCCSPAYQPQKGSVNPAWPGGYHCPCHGSLYDLSGRVYKAMPAPRNMAVPEYEFLGGGRKVRITALYPPTKLC